MDENENKRTEEETGIELPSGYDLTEEERQEILSVFSETNENKRRKSGFNFTVKNQIILIASVLAVALLLLGSYYLFFKQPDPLPDFYQLDAKTADALDALDVKVKITFCRYDKKTLSEGTDADLQRIYNYATLYADHSRKVKLAFAPGDNYDGVKVQVGDKTKLLPYSSFYKARLADGKIYGFDGESLLTNAILELTGKELLTLDVRPLSGFDKDGDEVLPAGGTVMFPMVARENILYITVKNSYGEYVIRSASTSGSSLYVEGCSSLTLNQEKFSSLIVDCRYVVTGGKVDSQLDYSVYGLGSEKDLTCSFTLVTKPDNTGRNLAYRVWVGKKTSTGAYYYAMVFGLAMQNGEVVQSNVDEQKPRVFLLPASNVDDNLNQPVECLFQARLTPGLETTNDLLKVNEIRMEYTYDDPDKQDVSMLALRLPILDFSENTSSNNSKAEEILKDKKTFASSGLSYTDWTSEKESAYLAGFASNDRNNKSFSITASMISSDPNGQYSIRFALAKDEDNAKYPALLPEKLVVSYSTDGLSMIELNAHGLDFSEQKENTVREYEIKIDSKDPILLVKLTFTMPDKIGYLVMDDLRLYAGEQDAVPIDVRNGIWRIVRPADMIAKDEASANTDGTNFSSFLQSLIALEGDSVARVNFSESGNGEKDDVIDMEKLSEFGLDHPAMHFSYRVYDILFDVYVSALDEEAGCYYAYSTMTGDMKGDGTTVTACTGLVARILPETAEWLAWEPVEFVEHSLIGSYIYDLEHMDITYNGKTHVFNVSSANNNVTDVTYEGQSMDITSFRYLYQSVVRLSLRDAYTEQEGDEPEEFMRILLKTSTGEREFVFYRVSSSRAYYTVNDDDAKHYCLVSSLRNVINHTERFIAGELLDK